LNNAFRDSIEGEYLEHDVVIDRVRGFFEIDKANGNFFVVIFYFFDDPSRERISADQCYRSSSLPKYVLIFP